MIDKCADNTVLIGQIIDDDDTHYRQEIDSFVWWCDQNHLELNVGKTKEMLMEFRKNKSVPDSVVIKRIEVERVETYKYLGVVFDSLKLKRTPTPSSKKHTLDYTV